MRTQTYHFLASATWVLEQARDDIQKKYPGSVVTFKNEPPGQTSGWFKVEAESPEQLQSIQAFIAADRIYKVHFLTV